MLYHYINKVPKTAADKGTGTVVSYPFGDQSINLVYGIQNVTNVDECRGVSLYFCKLNKNDTAHQKCCITTLTATKDSSW